MRVTVAVAILLSLSLCGLAGASIGELEGSPHAKSTVSGAVAALGVLGGSSSGTSSVTGSIYNQTPSGIVWSMGRSTVSGSITGIGVMACTSVGKSVVASTISHYHLGAGNLICVDVGKTELGIDCKSQVTAGAGVESFYSDD